MKLLYAKDQAQQPKNQDEQEKLGKNKTTTPLCCQWHKGSTQALKKPGQTRDGV